MVEQSAPPPPALGEDGPGGAHRRSGVAYSLAAYVCWGLFPLYLTLIRNISPLEFLMHRMLWSVLFVFGILGLRRRWNWLGTALTSWTVMRRFAASAAVLTVNWFVFVWAVGAGRVVDASLGYFINPLVTVALGAIFLRERLRRAQVAAVALAAAGVLWLVIQVGQVPWIGLALATSFAGYGLLRKTATLGALEGLALETLLLSPLALGCLTWLAARGESAALVAPPTTQLLILLAGPLTAIPLLLFAAGARRIPLSMLGLLQYVSPTLQLLVGVALLREPFNASKLVGYGFIWLGCAAVIVDALQTTRVRPSAA